MMPSLFSYGSVNTAKGGYKTKLCLQSMCYKCLHLECKHLEILALSMYFGQSKCMDNQEYFAVFCTLDFHSSK